MSKFVEMIVKREDVANKIQDLLKNQADKNFVVYGSSCALEMFNEKFDLLKKLKVVGFINKSDNTCNGKLSELVKTISADKLGETEFDYVLVLDGGIKNSSTYPQEFSKIEDKIVILYNETVMEEALSYNYLEQYGFGKNLQKLSKKLKGKSVILYGAGVYLETIKKHYDLSKLNIIGVCDRKFENHDENQKFLDYKVYSIDEVKDLKPDYILVATKFYVNIIEDMYYGSFKNCKIKIKPLVHKSFFSLVHEALTR